MATEAEHNELTGAANQMMRRLLHEVEALNAQAERDAAAVRAEREQIRSALAKIERDARDRATSFAPRNLGGALRRQLSQAFDDAPRRRTPEAPPPSLDAAGAEWDRIAGGPMNLQGRPWQLETTVDELAGDRNAWKGKLTRRFRSEPVAASELWTATDRLQEICDALPALRERFVVSQLEAQGHLSKTLEDEIARRGQEMSERYERLRAAYDEVTSVSGVAGAGWDALAWADAAPAEQLQRVIRLGEFATGLPAEAQLSRIPALIEFPFHSGIAIRAEVDQRQVGIDLIRSLIVRLLAAIPPGEVRFTFIDPVSVGQNVAEFRHLAEYDARLVDVKTWTRERDIDDRLEEMADHLQVVISSYLRGQFESIDDYNQHAGEVAEPYRVIVVFDYPHGFNDRSARQLLSLIENGPRCGVHTMMLYDAAQNANHDLTLDRLVHSMRDIDLTASGARASLDEPIGRVELGFHSEVAPPIAFAIDGRASSPFAQLLLNVGSGARTSHSGPVTLDRVQSIVNRLVASGRAEHVPRRFEGAPDLTVADPDTWWSASSRDGAFAPIGRAGAQDVAAMYFSSTEVAGGGIVVGLPRSGKTTALHAAILSLCLTYPPSELELYLIDSKHGVEFQIYDGLPHARLVSVNSAREFAVSVLESLAGEIKRRAELMKRSAVGRTNLTEYREATGEVLSRVVLFMDEFHEVFEEDDPLGRAAFAAFSDIVRQGPFAGVHVIVASQTLSSMPALDRSTLSLLPMRVAFMCNEIDADIVMGDDNREARALTQQGEGIFNPSRGDTSHNKPFKGLYVPHDQRQAMLAALRRKAESVGWERLPRVFDGETLAQRDAQPVGGPTRPTFAIGEPFSLETSAGFALRRGRGANVLVLGRDDSDAPDIAIDAVVHSCLGNAAVQGLTATVVDFIGDADGDPDALGLIDLCDELGISYRRASALSAVLDELTAEIARRAGVEAYGDPGRILILNGVERASTLSPPPDPGYDDAEVDDATALGRVLRGVLVDGPEFGCHVFVVVDALASFERRVGQQLLHEFEWRAAGSAVSTADVETITGVFNESQVERNQIIIVDVARHRHQRVRGYPRYTRTSIATITPHDRSTP